MERITKSREPTRILLREETLRSDAKLGLVQSYKNKEHSVGVIYLSILNFPRTERFKFENSLIIGIIPGPKEPSFHINSYISPVSMLTVISVQWLKSYFYSKKDN